MLTVHCSSKGNHTKSVVFSDTPTLSIIVAHTESCCNLFACTSFKTGFQPAAGVHPSCRCEPQKRFSGSLQIISWWFQQGSPGPALWAFLCLLIFRFSRHFTICTFQKRVFVNFLWTKADIKQLGGKRLFCLDSLANMHVAYKLPFEHSEQPWLPPLLALGAGAFIHPAQLLEMVISSVRSTSVLSPTTSDQLILPLSAVTFILSGFICLITFFSTCMSSSCSAWWDTKWRGLSKPQSLCRTLEEEMEDWRWRGDTGDTSAVSRVWRGQVFLKSLIRFHPFSLSWDEEVPRLSSSGSSRNVACSCWASLWCKQLSLCWSKGGKQLHVRGKSGPLPSDYIVIFHKSVYQQLLQPSATKEQFFFLQIRVNAIPCSCKW